LDTIQNLFMGFQVALSWQNLFFCFMGCLMGTLIGVLPGIGPAAGVSILIPLTFGMDTTTVYSRQRAG
jgi:putative tricarboxylic transport membrane protein